MGKKLSSGIIAAIGYILSPLSWWNDLFVNIPLAYVFSLPFAFLSRALFLPAFLLGYWFTNILGLLLLHYGARGMASPAAPLDLKKYLLISLVYTLLVAALVLLGWIKSPLASP